MNYQLLAIVLAVIVVLCVLLQQVNRMMARRRDLRAARAKMHDAEDGGYVFLIDKNLEVKETNYYDLNPGRKREPPFMLGNVLHCQTGTDCGLCGTGFACNTCPVRFCLKNAFQQKRNVSDVRATMTLYDNNDEAASVDVSLSGELVYIGGEPHLIVRVKECK
ncbi:MAG: hypothetical protein IJ527_06505 [Prevotella sp.]|nr:hypothetical protein [Prevotella sp.]